MPRHRLTCFLFTAFLLTSSLAHAAGPSLFRIPRMGDGDRRALLTKGIPLVMENEHFFLAMGDETSIRSTVRALGREAEILDGDTSGFAYFAAQLRPGAETADIALCAEPIYAADSWVLVRSSGDMPPLCMESEKWLLRRVAMRPLALPQTLPEPYATWQQKGVPQIDVNPVVQLIVNNLSNTTIQSNWEAIVNVATTRYSRSTGCQTAAQSVFDKFQALGLNPVFQNHTSGHAPNIIGTITGYAHPEQVVIVIGHLDDMPSSGAAPGADDNASGAATVTSVAQAMAGYTYEKTIKFLAVTGEEQGLYGSEYYAAQAASAGEQIVAVLNADMNGWQGDGLPATGENLDVNTNSTSSWLGQLMQQAATAYGTGCVINYFSCASMVYSDHAPFWDHGWSAICGITDNEGSCGQTGSYPYYHTSNDTLANCGAPAFFHGTVKAYLATAAHIAVPLCGGGAFPPVPSNVTAAGAGANKITVSWASGGSAIEYEILRGRGSCSAPYQLVTTTASTSFTDTNVSGGVTYAYRVRAKRGTCVTAESTCATASTTGACQEYPEFAGATSASNAAQPVCTVTVSWNAAAPFCSGPVTYNVYRSTVSPFVPGPSNRIATGISGLSYTDASGLVSSTPVHYIVRAVDSSNGAEDQNTVVRTASPTGPIALANWTDDAGDTGSASMTLDSPWTIDASGGQVGAKTYKTTATNNVCASLTSGQLLLGSNSVLTFFSKWFLDMNGGDKGQVEISTDGGAAWTRLEMAYPTSSSKTGDACAFPANKKYFSGINQTWSQFTVLLYAYEGMNIKLRFRLSTDATSSGETWWIDGISITNVQLPSACGSGTGPGLQPLRIAVDAQSYAPGTSNANKVLEPGEQVRVSPSWQNSSAVAISATGTVSGLTGPAGATYSLLDAAAAYGSIAAGGSATATADSYAIGVSDPAVRPATHWDVTVTETLSTGAVKTWTLHIGKSFADVPNTHWAYGFVETIFHNGITAGCGSGNYCPALTLTRAEMAVLLLMAKHGTAYKPPLSTGNVFADVPIDYWAGDFIEAMAAEGITSGCGGGNFCPASPITRAQMAVFLLVAKHGSSWTPPPATGTVFADVPAGYWAGAFIEALAAEGITGGCGGGNYCPEAPVTRAEMAVFLTATFNLQ